MKKNDTPAFIPSALDYNVNDANHSTYDPPPEIGFWLSPMAFCVSYTNVDRLAEAPRFVLEAGCKHAAFCLLLPSSSEREGMSSIFRRLLDLPRQFKERSRSSSVGRPSINQNPGESAINLDLVATPSVNQPSDSPDEKKLYLAAGITVLKHLKEISEASNLLGPLKAACGAATVILETIEAMDSNKDAWRSTLRAIQRHQRMFEQQLTNMSAQSVPPNAEPGLLEPIKAYGQDLKSILGALMLENGISAQNMTHEPTFQSLATFMKRYGTVKVEADKISGYVDDLDAAMKQFTTSLAVYTGFKLHSMEQRLVAIDTKLQVSNPDIVITEVKLKPRPRLVPNFIGREDILEAMRRAHFDDDNAQQSQITTILSGIGGLGKTQTALKFALEFEKKYPGALIYFLDASAPEKLQIDLENLIRSRGMAYHTKSSEDALVWLASEHENWLVILDNVDDPNIDPIHYIPQCEHGHVIITTRNATLAALAPNTSHALEGLSTHDSTTFLLTASNYPNIQENQELAEKIVRELGCLPLALSHAAGYIFVHRCLGSYLEIYHKNREKILASTNSRPLHGYRSSVATTIEMSLEKLSERAREVIRLFSHLQATSIPHAMIMKAAEHQFRRVERTSSSSLNPETLKQADALMKIFCPGGEWSDFDFNECIHECLRYSLLQLTMQNDDKFYSMHVLVQSHLQEEAGIIQGHQSRRLVCRLLGSAVTVGKRYQFLAFDRLLLPHIRLVQIEDVNEPGDHYSLGHVLDEVGDARQALVHWEKCVEIWSRLLGKEDEHTVEAMECLAISYNVVGKNQAAVELQEGVLSLKKRLLGPEHPDTVLAMDSLAVFYMDVGKNQAALELLEEVLSLRKRLLGSEHPDTARTMGNLARSYNKAGKNHAALELQEEVLSLRKRLLGLEHPDTIRAMYILSRFYRKAGKNQEGLQLQEEVLSLRKRLLGPEHPETVFVMDSLAIFYMDMGNNQAAMELEEEVLSLQRRLLGPQHRDTLKAMRNLLTTYKKLDMQAQRLSLLRTALPAHETSELFGVDHPKTVKLRNDLKLLEG